MRSRTRGLLVALTMLLGSLAGVLAAAAARPQELAAQTCSHKACNIDTNRCEPIDFNYKCSELVKWGCTFTQAC
jgi:hypothetical protein